MKTHKRKNGVVKAEKLIPRHKRAGKWIRAHKRDIILSLEALASLVVQYWWYRRRLMKMNREFAKLTSESMKSSAAQLSGAVKLLDATGKAAVEVGRQQVEQKATQQLIDKRLQVLEETLKDPRFRKFLKEKHGITELKPVK